MTFTFVVKGQNSCQSVTIYKFRYISKTSNPVTPLHSPLPQKCFISCQRGMSFTLLIFSTSFVLHSYQTSKWQCFAFCCGSSICIGTFTKQRHNIIVSYNNSVTNKEYKVNDSCFCWTLPGPLIVSSKPVLASTQVQQPHCWSQI